MNDTVTKLVNIVFEDAGDSREARDMKEAVLRDCQERFDEMVAEGIDEDEAIAAVVESLQGMEEIVRSLRNVDKEVFEESVQDVETAPQYTRRLKLNLKDTDVHFAMTSGQTMEIILPEGEKERFHVENQNGWTCITEQEYTVERMDWYNLFSGIRTLMDMKQVLQKIGNYVQERVHSGDMTIKVPAEYLEEVQIHVVNGDISWEKVGCPQISIQGTNGDIDLDTAMHGNSLQISMVNGDAEVRADYETLNMTTVNGDMEVEGTFEHVSMKSVSGDLDLDLIGTDHAEVYMKSTSGDIHVGLPSGTERVRAKMHSISGDMKCDFPSGEDAPFRIEIQTVSGDGTID